ncbi:MAG: cytochrome P460 family protein [Stappiaceae bacterium]
MKKILLSAVALAVVVGAGISGSSLFPSHAQAQSDGCNFNKAPDDFEQAEIDKLYECLKDSLAEGYGQADHEIGANYRNWKLAQQGIGPAFAGHGNRFLQTYVNDVGFDEYVKYQDEGGFSLPAGSIVAKESWKVKKDGSPVRGPLLIMTKLKAGEATEFGDWLYSGVSPGSGKNFKVSQKFCHDCHGVFEDQDALGYPAEEVRLGN